MFVGRRSSLAGLLLVCVLLHSGSWALNYGPHKIVEDKLHHVIFEVEPTVNKEFTYLPDEMKTLESLEEEPDGGLTANTIARVSKVKAKQDWISEHASSTIKHEQKKAEVKRVNGVAKTATEFAWQKQVKSKIASPALLTEPVERLIKVSYDEALRSVKLSVKKPVSVLSDLDCGGRVCRVEEKCVTRLSQVKIDQINKMILKLKQDYHLKFAVEIKKHSAALSSRILKDNLGEKFSHSCEGGVIKISCPAEYMIRVLRGFYGRKSDAYCNHGTPKTYQCSSPQATGIFASQCNGKQSCRVNTGKDVFGEPCVGTYKYATVTFKCSLSAKIRKRWDIERMQLNKVFHLKMKEFHDVNVRQLKLLGNQRAEAMRGNQLCVANTTEFKGQRPPVVPRQGITCGLRRCRISQRCIKIRRSAKTIAKIKAEIKIHKQSYQTKHAELRKHLKVALGTEMRPYLPEQFNHACEHATMTVSCPHNYVIQVIRGFYGRRSDAYCNRGKPKTFSCSSDRANSVIASLCNMKNSCSVKSSNYEFGNPCAGTFKYASIHYRCRLSLSVKKRHASVKRRLVRRFQRQLKVLGGWYRLRLKVLNHRLVKAAYGTYRCLSKTGLGDLDDRQRHGSRRGSKCGQTRCSRGQRCVRKVSKRRLKRITHKMHAIHNEFEKAVSAATRQQNAAIDSKTVNISLSDQHNFACEGDSVRISCPVNYTIEVLKGFYGRTSDTVCATGPRKSLTCTSPKADDVVMSTCNGKQDCTVQSKNEVFGDPCHGTYKYLTVNYRCRLTLLAEKQFEAERTQLTKAFNRHMSELRHRYTLTIASLKAEWRRVKRGKERCVRRERKRPRLGIECGQKRCKPGEKCAVKKSKKLIRQLNDGIIALTSLFNQKIAVISQEQLSALRKNTPAIYLAEKFERACEGAALSIDCPKDYVIQVLRGFYGRTSNTYCSHGPMKTNKCSSSKANSHIISACNNKRSCTVTSSNSIFGDPCAGTYKYMTINYKCRLTSTVAKQFQTRKEQLNLRFKTRQNALRIVYNRHLASLLRKLSRAKLGEHCCVPDKQSRGGDSRGSKQEK